MNFVEKAQARHGFRYDYSQVVYKGGRVPVTVICKDHGAFTVCPEYHLHKKKALGCPICSKLAQNQKQTLSLEELLTRFKSVHGSKYDYSKVVYTAIHDPVTIVCKTHGEFAQSANNHRKGMGCPQCGRQRMVESQLKTTAQFVQDARQIHGQKYNYEKTNYVHSKRKLTIVCPQHGEFQQAPYVHLSGKGCPSCSSSASKAEAEVAQWCDDNQVFYQRETVIRAYNKYKRFDFYFPSLDCYVELDGKFHWLPIFGQKRLQLQQERDRATNEWCQRNGVCLHRFKSAAECIAFLKSAHGL